MKRKDDKESVPNELLERYEQFLSVGTPGYFDVDELEDLSEFYRIHGLQDKSSGVLDLGLKLHPDNSSLMLRQVALLVDSGRHAKALRVLETLPEKESLEVQLLKAEIYLHMKREAAGLGLLRALMHQEAFNRVDLLLDVSGILTRAGKLDLAKEVLWKALQEHPDDEDLLEELTYVLEELKDYQALVQIYDKLLDADPYRTDTWFNAGQAWFNLERYDKAIEAYDFAWALSEDDFLPLLQKGHALFQSEQYEKAAQMYETCISHIEPADYIHLLVGEAYEKAGLYEKAIVHFDLVLTMFPENIEAYAGLGLCYMELKEFKKSLGYLEKALLIDDSDAELWVYMAELMLQMERKDEAYVSYLRSLSIDPNQADVLAVMGNISYDNGNYDQALELYRAAQALDPELPGLPLFFALAYVKTGQTQLSKEYLDLARQKDSRADVLFEEMLGPSDLNPND